MVIAINILNKTISNRHDSMIYNSKTETGIYFLEHFPTLVAPAMAGCVSSLRKFHPILEI